MLVWSWYKTLIGSVVSTGTGWRNGRTTKAAAGLLDRGVCTSTNSKLNGADSPSATAPKDLSSTRSGGSRAPLESQDDRPCKAALAALTSQSCSFFSAIRSLSPIPHASQPIRRTPANAAATGRPVPRLPQR